MGRYYSGDIEGKFMFGVQSSLAADRFGSEGVTNYADYYFDEDQLETINEELEELECAYDKVSKFFENREGYSNEDLEEFNISRSDLRDYADYVLGDKIRECIIKDGSCSFVAEL